MRSLGLDVGTTSISLAVIDEHNRVIDTSSFAHHAAIPSAHPWENIQDAGILLSLALDAVEKACRKHQITSIGITGQQHGIAYLNKEGRVISPLYTWQDRRALEPVEETDYISAILETTGYAIHAGYGLATHYYNVRNGLVPDSAVSLGTIPDLAAMRLAGMKTPVMEASNAHSCGLYDLAANDFDRQAIARCGIETAMIPELCIDKTLGFYHGIPVAAAIGDNQASYIGATCESENAVLINIGTGSQVTLHTEHIKNYANFEVRPYPLGGYLLTGASLSGGRTWAMTERFFHQAVFELTGIDTPVYDGLNRLLDHTEDNGDYPFVTTSFDGTRSDPHKRGSIENIAVNNFTPGQFALGILHGMANELHEMYSSALAEELEPKTQLIGSGNGLRRNPHLQQIVQETFKMPLKMSVHTEEAAVGAAIFARKVTT